MIELQYPPVNTPDWVELTAQAHNVRHNPSFQTSLPGSPYPSSICIADAQFNSRVSRTHNCASSIACSGESVDLDLVDGSGSMLSEVASSVDTDELIEELEPVAGEWKEMEEMLEDMLFDSLKSLPLSALPLQAPVRFLFPLAIC